MKKRGLFIILACAVFLVWTMSCQSPSSSGNPASSKPAADNQPSSSNSDNSSNSGTGNDSEATTGFLTLVLKDAPVDTAKNVWVKISNIRVHEACDDGDGCFHTVWENSAGHDIDLLALQATPVVLPTATLPAGTYNQIRMDVISGKIVFASSDPANPPDLEFPLKVPSEEIKTHLHFEVEAGKTIRITLDLDAKNSIHIIKKGKKDEYQLRPVVNVVAIEDEPAS
jgi:hypothetical protein